MKKVKLVSIISSILFLAGCGAPSESSKPVSVDPSSTSQASEPIFESSEATEELEDLYLPFYEQATNESGNVSMMVVDTMNSKGKVTFSMFLKMPGSVIPEEDFVVSNEAANVVVSPLYVDRKGIEWSADSEMKMLGNGTYEIVYDADALRLDVSQSVCFVSPFSFALERQGKTYLFKGFKGDIVLTAGI